jgi:hypothetical protein
MNREAHPEWGEIHLHALLAGLTTALTLWRIGAPVAEQMAAFQAGETVGAHSMTHDDRRFRRILSRRTARRACGVANRR